MSTFTPPGRMAPPRQRRPQPPSAPVPSQRRPADLDRPARAWTAPPLIGPAGILALIAGGAVATVSLWWSNTPNIHGSGDWLTNAGRITGLLAGYAMVVLVVLMARIPPVERGVGADRLARWHAMGGRYTVCLVVAHALLITWGYAVTAHTGIVHQTGTLLNSYPDVLAATVAGLLLVGVGVSSARKARRRLAYETWYFLHFYTYLAVALAFSHQFANGSEFVSNRPARVLWAAMYVAAAAAIAFYRFLVPARLAWRQRLEVTSVVSEAPGVVSVYVRGRDLTALRAESGQFFRWRFLTRGLWWVSSPYSLSEAPGGTHLRITVKALGGHSAALARLRPGTRVLAEGPYGAMTSRARRGQKVLMIAGGVGITPLRALFESIPVRGADLTLLYRASSADDVVFGPELRDIAERRQARLHVITGGRRELGGDPLSAASLRAGIPDLADHDVYVCGPAGLTTSVIQALRSCGVSRRRIHHESFEF